MSNLPPKTALLPPIPLFGFEFVQRRFRAGFQQGNHVGDLAEGEFDFVPDVADELVGFGAE